LAIDAFNSRDIESLISFYDPDIVFHSALSGVGGTTYRGHDGLRL